MRGQRRFEVHAQENIIVGLDIGTTKICAVVAEISNDTINIIGIGSHPSTGLRKGVVVDIDSTVHSIRKAIDEAELMADCEIKSVYAGIAGGHITGFNSQGVIAIKSPEIMQQDVDRVIEAARAVTIPVDREVIHILPQEFIVDGQGSIHSPLGMAGIRLEARIHIVTAAVACAHNIVKCANKAGLEISDIVLEPLASAKAVMTSEEKELGAALLDIGGGTTDLAVFNNNTIRHTFVLGLGGNNLTNDISIGIRSPLTEAEKIKIEHGTCVGTHISGEDVLEVPGIGGRKPRQLRKQVLCEIIEPRVEEIFSLIKTEIQRAGMENVIASGIVLTGGTAMLDGMTEVAESIFNVPARMGTPQGVSGLMDVVNSPQYATGVGLVLYGAKNQSQQEPFKTEDINVFNRLVSRMKKWFRDIV
jgi:cell division protein FtsA